MKEAATYYMYSGEDRRISQRFGINLRVFYQIYSPLYLRGIISDQDIQAISLELSKGGMAILTDRDIPLWTLLLVKIVLYKTDSEGSGTINEVIEVIAEVNSNTALEDNTYRLGICFKAMDEGYRDNIDKFVESLK